MTFHPIKRPFQPISKDRSLFTAHTYTRSLAQSSAQANQEKRSTGQAPATNHLIRHHLNNANAKQIVRARVNRAISFYFHYTSVRSTVHFIVFDIIRR